MVNNTIPNKDMKENDNLISIVTVSDNQYCPLLAALLKSIEMNSNKDSKFNLYVVSDGISTENRSKLQQSVTNSISLEFVDIKTIIKESSSLPLDSSSFPLNVYVRLFIPYFIPENISRIIYLDVDMIAKVDISKLWHIDLHNCAVGAVADRCETIGNPWGGIRNYTALKLNPTAKYMNSGLLVIDIEKWRNSNYTEQILSCISNNKAYANYPDQYGLNVVFHENWFELDQRWNCFSYSKIPDPYIIHFIGIKPIFESYDANQHYRRDFFFYLQLTEWKNFKVLSNQHRLWKKLKNIIVKKGLSLFKRQKL